MPIGLYLLEHCTPTGGRDPMVAIRMPQPVIADADAWGQTNNVGRSEAIRRLVELGLKAKGIDICSQDAMPEAV